MVDVAEVSDIDYSVEDMERCIARFSDQKSSDQAFLDTRIPGFEREIFSIIGTGVQEDSAISAPIEAQDFHVAYIRAEPGKGAALHSHLTQEVFVPMSGRWAILWGPDGEKQIEIGPLDVISVPVHVMRGFRNVSDDTAVMLAIVGGNDPGRVGWPESLKTQARDAGLVIDDDGNLVDVA